MIPSNVSERGKDAGVPAYENLRREVLAGAQAGNHFGLVVLLREGVAAWIAGGVAAAAFRPATKPWPQTASPPLSDANELQAGVVRLLAGMALANQGEMRR